MIKIDHPQIYIYSYQLKSKTTSNPDSIGNWLKSLTHHFTPSDSSQSWSLTEFNELLSPVYPFSYSDKIDGSFKFSCLDDTVGILTRIGSPETKLNQGIDLTEIRNFNPNNLLLAPHYETWLGQTILITYKLENEQKLSQEKLREIADQCLNQLLPETSHPPFCRSTKLFHTDIFEYSFPQNQLQIFVYNIDGEIEAKLGSIIQPLFELFFHRHKITKNFIDSRKTYDLTKNFYQQIEIYIEDLETQLEDGKQQSLSQLKNKIKQSLRDQLDYQRLLQVLEDIDNTISIHAYNYQQKLEEIREQCQLESEEDLRTFNQFMAKTVPYIQRQITADLGYFQHGTTLIEMAIETLRGIIEIEQTESDRSLERTIQILASGLGAGGIVASAVSGHIEKPLVWKIPQPGDPIHPGVISLFFSFLAVLIVGGLVGVINGTWKITRQRNRK